MGAAVDAELAGDIWVLALLDVLDVSSVDSDRHIVLGLASDRTGMTADALSIVYHETVVHHVPPSTRADSPT